MIQYTEVEELPEHREGFLAATHHRFTGVSKFEDDCGSHGCTGHTYRKLVCTCGLVVSVSDYSESEQAAIRNHKNAVIEHHLGLVFEW